jgi:hypothetical protein
LADDAGAVHGQVSGVVPGPDHSLLTVRLARSADDGRPDQVQAVADPDLMPEVGSAVRLRLDPAGVALFGTDGDARDARPHDTLSG